MDGSHNDEFNTMLYVPTGPDCEINRQYQRRLRHSFITRESPPNFEKKDNEVNFKNSVTFDDLSETAKLLMGWNSNVNKKQQLISACHNF